jgi:4-diphosphocytidyl-2-C-methyl-D-erythritol kinase
MTQTWPAPAKLNLFLHVTGRRPDGYHTLQTVFQFLDVGDVLRFELTADGRITRATLLPGVPEDRDLTVRAARLLQETAGVTRGCAIHLDKRLPAGGGLGGGSSDAATTLLALNRLWACGLSTDTLAALGLRLGADVPVFVRGHAAWAEGVGEVLTPVDPPETWYVVLVPGVSVSTAEVFQAFDREQLTPSAPVLTIRDFHAGRTHNDLEPVVRRLYPEVDNALKWLGNFGEARMTGSGACVFLAVDSEARGQEVLASHPAALGQGFVARGRNVHPFYEGRGTGGEGRG